MVVIAIQQRFKNKNFSQQASRELEQLCVNDPTAEPGRQTTDIKRAVLF